MKIKDFRQKEQNSSRQFLGARVAAANFLFAFGEEVNTFEIFGDLKNIFFAKHQNP